MLPKLHANLYLLFFFLVTQTISSQESLRNNGQMRSHSGSQTAFYGDFINDQLFSNNRGNVYFVGSALQTIQGTGPTLQMDNVILRNGNSLIIRTPITNSTSLDFQNGRIITPRVTPSVNWLFQDNSTYNGANDARHVHGYVAKTGIDSFSFPIGDGQRLRPAAIAPQTDIKTAFRAAYFRGSPSAASLPVNGPFPVNRVSDPDLKIDNNEYWDIDGNTSARITLTWNASSFIDTLSQNDISRLVVAGWNGTEWVNLGSTGTTGDIRGFGQVTSRVVTPDSFNVFTIAAYKQTCFANTVDIDLGIDRAYCQTNKINLKAPNGFTRYEWQDGSSDSSFLVTKDGVYWVKAWDLCGNYKTDSVEFKLYRTIGIKVNPIGCRGQLNGSIVLSDTSNIGISLNNSIVNFDKIKSLQEGNYLLTLSLIEGCSIDTTIEIKEAAFVEIGKDTIQIEDGESVVIEVKTDPNNPPAKYNWYPAVFLDCTDCESVEARPPGKINYTVEVVDSAGCISTDNVTVVVNTKYGIYIPNAFNPDREEFTILGNGDIDKVLKMQIFDRWGTLLYELANFKPDGSVGWDGMHRNKPAMRGTYVVSLEIRLKDGNIKNVASEFLLSE